MKCSSCGHDLVSAFPLEWLACLECRSAYELIDGTLRRIPSGATPAPAPRRMRRSPVAAGGPDRTVTPVGGGRSADGRPAAADDNNEGG